jgi:hypothetical protein
LEYDTRQNNDARIAQEDERALRPPPVQPRDPAADFLRGNKRSKSDYKPLKDMSSFDKWKLSFVAVAASHLCSEVLDSDYVPQTPAEIALFAAQETFMYSVFDETLKESTARSFFTNNPGNPQQIWKLLIDHSLTSAAGGYENQRLLK